VSHGAGAVRVLMAMLMLRVVPVVMAVVVTAGV
jgi:hypothetical protein